MDTAHQLLPQIERKKTATKTATNPRTAGELEGCADWWADEADWHQARIDAGYPQAKWMRGQIREARLYEKRLRFIAAQIRLLPEYTSEYRQTDEQRAKHVKLALTKFPEHDPDAPRNKFGEIIYE